MSAPRANLRAGAPGAATAFETNNGPFWHRMEDDGSVRCAFRVEKKHLNGGSNVHGGCFMSFADYCLFAIAAPMLQGPGVTMSFRLRISRRRARGRADRRPRRGHPRRRLADLPARHADLRRAAAVHVFRHDQAGEAEASRPSFRNRRRATCRSAAEIETEAAPVPAPSQPAGPHSTAWRDYALLLALACCWSSTYPLTKIGAGSIPPITFISARSLVAAAFLLVDPADPRHQDADRPKAWKMFAFQQLINSTFPVPDHHLGAALRAGIEHGGAGLDHADLRLRHHLGDHAA